MKEQLISFGLKEQEEVYSPYQLKVENTGKTEKRSSKVKIIKMSSLQKLGHEGKNNVCLKKSLFCDQKHKKTHKDPKFDKLSKHSIEREKLLISLNKSISKVKQIPLSKSRSALGSKFTTLKIYSQMEEEMKKKNLLEAIEEIQKFQQLQTC